MTDAVDKPHRTGISSSLPRLPNVLALIGLSLPDRAAHDADATTDAHATNATHASAWLGGGRNRRSAIVLRFCTMAARWNSSRAPLKPRSRMRSKP